MLTLPPNYKNVHAKKWLSALISGVLLILIGPSSYAMATDYPACTIQGASSAETLTGTDGNDVICTGGGDDYVDARGGDDLVIIEDDGSVEITLGPGDDVLHAESAESVIVDGRSEEHTSELQSLRHRMPSSA